MMTNNKILTVSYGTFSCTLEGFDDSFGTMKAIAEYFRDLAADDRYFGAEPPQPDAEMLARIAEREISRRVAAREQEGRIVLSAEPEVGATPAALAVASVAAAAPEVVAPAAQAEPEIVADTARDVADEATEGAPEVTEDAVAEIDIDSVTAALDATDTADEAAADAQSDDAEDALAEVADAEEPVATEDSAEAFFADSTVEDPEEDFGDAAVADIATADEVAPDTPPAPDSIAAKLQRIRAVVSQSKETDDDVEMFEDEHADAFVDASASTDADADVETELEEDAADDAVEESFADAMAAFNLPDEDEDSAEETVMDADDDDDVADILAQLESGAADDVAEASDLADAVSDEAVAEFAEDAATGTDSLAADLDIDTGDADDADNLFDADDAPEVAAEEAENSTAEDDAGEADAEPEAADVAPQPRRARIIKVKRADIDAALAQGQIEEITDEDEAKDTPVAGSSLSEEDEAELQAELAAVSAELPGADAESAVDLDDAPVAEADVEGDEAQEKQVADADVSRLMAEAESQMEEPEGSRRRNAFQHLKAAVLAKKADSGIGDDTIKDEGAFRSDLASVVVPRRPSASSTGRDARPSAERPAPLKLVAEQRVDIEGATPTGPVRPRRIAQSDGAAAQDSADGSFADYAADMGAHSLPDLLEAAASYLSFVEGHDQFSRPQLMTKVRQVEKEDFSREDGLRSFGQLLRAGKIEKRKGGRFTVTSDIGYRPDERAAG